MGLVSGSCSPLHLVLLERLFENRPGKSLLQPLATPIILEVCEFWPLFRQVFEISPVPNSKILVRSRGLVLGAVSFFLVLQKADCLLCSR